jgi:hypothetical protein
MPPTRRSSQKRGRPFGDGRPAVRRARLTSGAAATPFPEAGRALEGSHCVQLFGTDFRAIRATPTARFATDPRLPLRAAKRGQGSNLQPRPRRRAILGRGAGRGRHPRGPGHETLGVPFPPPRWTLPPRALGCPPSELGRRLPEQDQGRSRDGGGPSLRRVPSAFRDQKCPWQRVRQGRHDSNLQPPVLGVCGRPVRQAGCFRVGGSGLGRLRFGRYASR